MGITYVLLAFAWLLLSAGIYLILTGVRHRDDRTVVEHLCRCHRSSVADEAEAWLKTRR